MAITLMEVGALYGTSALKAGVLKVMAQASPVLDRIPFHTFEGNAYSHVLETALPPHQFRAVNGAYTRGSGSGRKITETVAIMGAEVFIDTFLLKVASNKRDLKASKFSEVARGVALGWDSVFFEGDSNTNLLGINGMRKRITGNQLLWAGANGAALSLTLMDQLLDLVTTPGKLLYMNRTLRRRLTDLLRAATGSYRVERTLDNYGKQVTSYDSVDIHIVERTDDGSTILDFDETRGNSNVTASVYCLSFGAEKYVFGLMGAGGSFDVKDLGESEIAPGQIGRIEWYPGIMIGHPRCSARLGGVTNA